MGTTGTEKTQPPDNSFLSSVHPDVPKELFLSWQSCQGCAFNPCRDMMSFPWLRQRCRGAAINCQKQRWVDTEHCKESFTNVVLRKHTDILRLGWTDSKLWFTAVTWQWNSNDSKVLIFEMTYWLDKWGKMNFNLKFLNLSEVFIVVHGLKIYFYL